MKKGGKGIISRHKPFYELLYNYLLQCPIVQYFLPITSCTVGNLQALPKRRICGGGMTYVEGGLLDIVCFNDGGK